MTRSTWFVPLALIVACIPCLLVPLGVRHRIVRNGHLPERTVLTGAGSLEVQQPRVRDRAPKEASDRLQFRSKILPPYLRRSASVDTLPSEVART